MRRALTIANGANPFELTEEEMLRLRTEQERARRAEMQQAVDMTGGSFRVPQVEVGPIETKRQGPSLNAPEERELPPRAADALERYVPPDDADVQKGRVRQFDSAPDETGELGVTDRVPRFDADASEALAPPASRVPMREEPAESRAIDRPVRLDQSMQGLTRDLEQTANDAIGTHQATREFALGRATREDAAFQQQMLTYREQEQRAQQRMAAATAKRDQIDAMAEAQLARLQQLAGQPPEATMDKASYIIEGLRFIVSRGKTPHPDQQIAMQLKYDVDIWKQEIAANQDAFDSALKMSKGVGDRALSEAELDSKLVDITLAQYKTAFEREKALATNAETVFAADLAISTAREAALKKQKEELWEREKYNRTEARLTRGESKEDDKIQRETVFMRALASLPPDQRLRAAQNAGPEALDALAKLQQSEQREKGLREEPAGGAKMTDGDKKLQRLAEGVRPAYKNLASRARLLADGTEDEKSAAAIPYVGIGPDATEFFAGEETQGLNNDIMQLANVLLRDESGANLPEAEQKTKWKTWGILSPDEVVRNRGLGKMLAEYEGRVAHVAPVTGGAGKGAQSAGPALVTMRSPSGRVVQVPAEKAEAAKANGYKPESVARGSSGGW